jgi:hypothetical protein
MRCRAGRFVLSVAKFNLEIETVTYPCIGPALFTNRSLFVMHIILVFHVQRFLTRCLRGLSSPAIAAQPIASGTFRKLLIVSQRDVLNPLLSGKDFRRQIRRRFCHIPGRLVSRLLCWCPPLALCRARSAPVRVGRLFSWRPRSCAACPASFPWRVRSAARPGHALRSSCAPTRPRPLER